MLHFALPFSPKQPLQITGDKMGRDLTLNEHFMKMKTISIKKIMQRMYKKHFLCEKREKEKGALAIHVFYLCTSISYIKSIVPNVCVFV